MRIIDISQKIYPEMLVYPGDPCYSATIVSSFERGDGYEVSQLHLGTHCGTHIDAPRHMIQCAPSIDEIPLDWCIGSCRIVTLCDETITKQMMEKLQIDSAKRLLIRTDPQGKMLDSGTLNAAAINMEAAEYLVQMGIRLIGIDSPSIENMDLTFGHVHEVLLRAGIVILEGLDLRHADIEQGFLCALPLKLEGENGSPCRAALICE